MQISLGILDLAVLCLYMLGAVALGLWLGRGQRDLSSYLLGGRDLPWWAILGSIVATETSTATFLSVPGIAYAKASGDLRFLQLTIGYVVGRILIVLILLPLYFRGQFYTAYTVLNERFGGATKTTASIIFLVTRNLGDGLRLFLTALALEQVIEWPLWACVVVIGFATILYTVFGGMKSVVWNDCIQMVIYVVGGLLAGLVILQQLPEGWSTFSSYAETHQKLRVFDYAFTLTDPYTLWAGLFGGMFLTLGTHGTDQMMVQRYLCARSQAAAGRALIASGFVVMLQFALFLLLGVGLACFYDTVKPEVSFERGDRVFATFIVHEMPRNVGLIGLLLAAVFAAAMSTLSSSLNSSASAVVNDLYKDLARSGDRPPTDKQLIRASRVCTVIFGLVQITIGIVAQWFSTSVVGDALAIAGFAAGLLLGVFALGVFTKHVGQNACLTGLVAGLLVLAYVQFGFPWPTPEAWESGQLWQHDAWQMVGPTIAWPWYALIGSTATFVAGLVASRIHVA